MEHHKYGYTVEVPLDFDTAYDRTVKQLKEEGFGVLTEIDVRATLKEKLDVDFRKYRILGACNPPLAHKALSAETELGLLLPCNVIVYDKGDGKSQVAAMDPASAMSMVDNPAVEPIAADVTERMKRVLNAVVESAAEKTE